MGEEAKQWRRCWCERDWYTPLAESSLVSVAIHRKGAENAEDIKVERLDLLHFQGLIALRIIFGEDLAVNLQGKVALVTGGARRLGKAVALKLAESGARVVVHYHRSAEDAAATAAAVRRMGGEARTVGGDLSQVDQVERIVDETTDAWGRLDVLVNNAAVFFQTPMGQVSEEQWDRLFGVNLKGAFFCAQRAAIKMRQNDGGVIVNFVDTGIYITWRGYTPYLISKAGVEQMTYALAKELAPDIRVNALAPGPLLLPDDHTKEEEERFASVTLLQRLGSSDALAEAALYLIQADYVTGVVLPVDGGQRWYGQ